MAFCLQEQEGMNILLTSLTFTEALPILQPQPLFQLDNDPPPDILLTGAPAIYLQTPAQAPPHPLLHADVVVFGILIVLAGLSRLIPLIYEAKNE